MRRKFKFQYVNIYFSVPECVFIFEKQQNKTLVVFLTIFVTVAKTFFD